MMEDVGHAQALVSDAGEGRAYKEKRPASCAGLFVLGVHALEEVIVVFRLLELVDQEVDAVHRAHRIENAAQDVHLGEVLFRNQQLFLPGAGLGDVERWENPFVGDLTIKNDFRIACTFEFFEDDFVHPRARIDQRRSDDGQGAAFFEVSRGAEKPLRPLQRIGVDAARQHLARRWNDGL